VTWVSATAGAVSFVSPILTTNAQGVASSDILAGVTPGSFDVQVTSMGETLTMTLILVNPGQVPPVTPPSPFPTGSQPGGPSLTLSAGTSGARAAKGIPAPTVTLDTGKNERDFRPTRTGNPVVDEAFRQGFDYIYSLRDKPPGLASLTSQVNSGLKTLTDQTNKIQATSGPVTFGPGHITFTGNLSATSIPEHADNATAIAKGLKKGQLYRTSTGQLGVVY
jgi:hypothetical protein